MFISNLSIIQDFFRFYCAKMIQMHTAMAERLCAINCAHKKCYKLFSRIRNASSPGYRCLHVHLSVNTIAVKNIYLMFTAALLFVSYRVTEFLLFNDVRK